MPKPTALAVLFATIFAMAAGAATAAISPPDGAKLTQIHIQFEWTPVANATGYEFEVFLAGGAKVAGATVDALKPRAIVSSGLDFGESYEWHVRDEGGAYGPMYAFSIAAIPAYMPVFSADEYEGDPEPGLTMFGIGSNVSPPLVPAGLAIAVNLDREVIWYMERPARVRDMRVVDYGRLQFLEKPGRSYITTSAGNNAWISPDDELLYYLHHEAFPMPNGDVLSIAYTTDEVMVEGQPQTWKGDNFLVFDRTTNDVRWSWNSFDHLPTTTFDTAVMSGPSCPGCGDTPFVGSYAWTHANASIYNQADDSVYISLRHLARIVRIDFQTGDIVYQMGSSIPGPVNFGDDSIFSWSHAPQMLENGNMVVYDNGNKRSEDQGKTRAVELQFSGEPIDSVTAIWKPILDNFTPALGDADRLPDGTTLTTQGFSGVLVEIDAAGSPVWELKLPAGNPSFQIYRSERIPGIAFDVPSDLDGDGVVDIADNCPDHPNPSQRDCDGDGFGDVCTVALGLHPEGRCEDRLPDFVLAEASPGDSRQEDPLFSGAATLWEVEGAGSSTQFEMLQNGAPEVISDPAFDNHGAKLSGTHAAWMGTASPFAAAADEAKEIFYFDGATRTRVTDNTLADVDPAVWHSRVAWSGDDRGDGAGQDRDIFLRDMESSDPAMRLTDNTLEDANPVVSGKHVAWRSRTGNPEVMLLDDVGDFFPASEDGLEKRNLRIWEDRAVWEGFDGSYWQIFYFDGSTSGQLTTGAFDSTNPQLSGAGIVWEQAGGVQLWRWTGDSIPVSDQGHSPGISATSLVFADSSGADDEVVIADVSNLVVRYATDNAIADTDPQVWGDEMAWERDGGVIFWNLAGGEQTLTFAGHRPHLSHGKVVWVQYDHNSNIGEFEITPQNESHWERDVWLFDGTTTTELNDEDGFCQSWPRVWDDDIVWEQRSYTFPYDRFECSGDPAVVHYQISTQTETVLNDCDPAHEILDEEICHARVTEGLVVWKESRRTWDDPELMFWTVGDDVEVLTEFNRREEFEPEAHTRLGWLGHPRPNWSLNLFDGEEILEITDGELDVDCLVMDGPRMAWVERVDDADGLGPRNGVVSMYDGREVYELQATLDDKNCPAISGSRVAWTIGTLSRDRELFVYDGSEVVQVTDDGSVADRDPRISGTNVVWEHDGAIHFYDGRESFAVSGTGSGPQIAGADLVWAAGSGDAERIQRAQVVPEPGLALLQLGAIIALAALGRRRGPGA